MRKEATVVIQAEGRDKGKIFRLTEMPAAQSEAWATRLMLALSRAGVEVPPGFFEMGMAGVAALGLKAMGGLTWDVAKPLLDEMMTCVKIQPSAAYPTVRALIDNSSDGDDIEEVATRIQLREEVITLHTGFSIREFFSSYQKALALRAMAAAEALASGQNTETSPLSSDGSYQVN